MTCPSDIHHFSAPRLSRVYSFAGVVSITARLNPPLSETFKMQITFHGGVLTLCYVALFLSYCQTFKNTQICQKNKRFQKILEN